jgi:hypothetical protein
MWMTLMVSTMTNQADGTVTSWPVHVIPIYDIKEHICTEDCWCSPTFLIIPRYGTEAVFMHHSADGREDFIEGRRQFS